MCGRRGAAAARSCPAARASQAQVLPGVTPGARPPVVRARHGHHQPALPAGGDSQPVAQAAAGALAVDRVVAALGRIGGSLARRPADHRRRDRPPEDRSCLTGAWSGPRGHGGAPRLARLGEIERPAGEGRFVLPVHRELRGRRLSPRVGAHQLRAGVHPHAHRARPAGGAQAQLEHRRSRAVGNEVGAADPEPRPRREVHARVAVAAGEAGGVIEPAPVHREPDAVEEFQGRRPHAAHLAPGVEAHGREVARLGADHVGPAP